MTNRVITPKDRENAARLRNIWEHKKRELGLTQVQLAAKMGYASQSMISQLLSCRVALSTDAIIRLAQVLRVNPEDIDPQLSALSISSTKLRQVKAPILARMSGAPCGPFETVEIATTMTRQVYAVAVDTDGYEPFAKIGCTLVLSQDELPVHGDEVFIRLHTDTGIVHLLKRFIATDLKRGVTVVSDLNTGAPEELATESVEVIDPVISVERPTVSRPIRLHQSRIA